MKAKHKITQNLVNTLFIIAAFLMVVLLPSIGYGQERPNIILILADDLGYGDVGFNGSEIPTPRIDDLASKGMIMERYYVAPVCSPTRAGLMTGRYPDRYGLRETVIPPWRDFGVDTAEVFLPEILEMAGYKHRAMIGKWHLGHSKLAYHPLNRGFTHFYGHYNGAIDYFTHKREGELDWHDDFAPSYDKGYATDLLAEEAVDCIKEYNGESPFFMYVAFNAPHSPLQAKEEDLLASGFDKSLPRFSTNKGYGEMGRGNTKKQTYEAMVRALDRGIGQIMDALAEEGILENTIVIFHSDNGPAPGEGGTAGNLRGHKFQEWEGGVRVPAVVYWKGKFDGGKKIDQVMGFVDMFPTLVELAGYKGELNLALDGLSMVSVLEGKEERIERDFYLGCGAMVTQSWKLVLENGGNPGMELKEDLLFNLQNDPYETKNVKKAYEERFLKMKSWIQVYEEIQADQNVPAYHVGKEGFKAPKEWTIQ
ncbi:arylsulfatase [Echinicola sp. CAU 1574]|uniref:Arylsulfatase n=1 Tax=Echinicola arenosa TaxID=2774144 RepID=A0ABR9AKY2_9BACT|nr:arylsulfatase [Echinicola arenosa]MBD8488254.1 arylsulfatase [Echinicola arenosa]